MDFYRSQLKEDVELLRYWILKNYELNQDNFFKTKDKYLS